MNDDNVMEGKDNFNQNCVSRLECIIYMHNRHHCPTAAVAILWGKVYQSFLRE